MSFDLPVCLYVLGILYFDQHPYILFLNQTCKSLNNEANKIVLTLYSIVSDPKKTNIPYNELDIFIQEL